MIIRLECGVDDKRQVVPGWLFVKFTIAFVKPKAFAREQNNDVTYFRQTTSRKAKLAAALRCSLVMREQAFQPMTPRHPVHAEFLSTSTLAGNRNSTLDSMR